MFRGKFFAMDDFDLAGHRLLNWRWLDDISTTGAVEGQALLYIDGHVVWGTVTATAAPVGDVEWDDIIGKPTVFPPEDHTHDWAEVTGKPSTFPPSSHTHPLSQLQQSGATAGQVATWNSTASAWQPADPTAGPGGGVDSVIAGTGIAVSTSVGDVTITCNLTWSELANKPATFPPSAHTHSLSNLTQTGASAGQVVTWDSTDAQWEPRTPAVSSSSSAWIGDTPLNVLPGSYVTPGRGGDADNAVASAAGRQIISPYIPTHTYTTDTVGFRISSGPGGSTGKVLVFDADADGRPTALLLQSAAIPTNAAGIVSDTVTFVFAAGKLYWVGMWTSANAVYLAQGQGAHYTLGYSGAAGASLRSLVRSQTYGGTSTDWTYSNADLSIINPPRMLFLKA